MFCKYFHLRLNKYLISFKITLYDFHVTPTLKECYHRHHIWYDQRPSKMKKRSFDTPKNKRKIKVKTFVTLKPL